MLNLASYAAPEASTWRAPYAPHGATDFHRSLPGYGQSALVEVPALAEQLGVAHLYVKDESSRLGLPAFKILGASWAVARAVGERADLDASALTLPKLIAHIDESGVKAFVAATDGNHGRAVARMAKLLGRPAFIFIPDGVTQAAQDAIKSEGATVIHVPGSYDGAVESANAQALSQPGALLIQDTSWEGYQDIPAWIVEGYQTLCAEIDEQLGSAPTVVVVPVGVGSLAEGVTRYYRGQSSFTPALLSVEPEVAACLLESLHAGALTSVETYTSIMAGLNCGTPSASAWPILQHGITGAVAVSEEDAADAVHELNALGVDSGPCGGATLAGLRNALADPGLRAALGVDASSTVILINTEGFSANPLPEESA